MKKLLSVLGIGAVAVALSGCVAPSGDYGFDPSKLDAQIYGKYWAMEEQDNVANVIQINRDGTATLWRYSCDKARDYQPAKNGAIRVERYKLSNGGYNEFNEHSLVTNGGVFSSSKINSITSSTLKVTQTILKVIPKEISYKAVGSPDKPLCAY